MDMEKLKQANALVKKLSEINEELEAWDATKEPCNLGMQQRWNNNYLVPLPCKHTPRPLFYEYRDNCINALKVKQAETEAELAAL